MVSMTTAIMVSAPWIESELSVPCRTVDGVDVVKLTKSDGKVHRLLVGIAKGSMNCLTNTTVLEDLTKLRNDKRLALLRAAAKGDDDLDEVDLDVMPNVIHLLPKVITIDVPTLGVIKVLQTLPHEPLWIELTPTTLEYLHEAVGHRPCKRRQKLAATANKPYFDQLRNAFRVRYTPNGESKTKMKDFRVEGDTEEATYNARAAANAFFDQFI